MLTILLDIAMAYVLAKFLKTLWAQVPLAILSGVVATIVVNAISHFLFTVPAGQAAANAVVGALWHPIITLVALWFFRRRLRKAGSETSNA